MDLCKQFCCFVCLLIAFQQNCAIAFDPLSATMAVGAATTSALFMLAEHTGITSLRCRLGIVECCRAPHIAFNETGLKHDLDQLLYGQHLVTTTVFKAVKAHVKNPHPDKPLVMSFHGWTGGGKNYVARMVIKNLYSKLQKSAFVHVFNAEVDFKHADQIRLYKDNLQSWLHGNVSACGRSIFIFDEMEQMPVGLIDAIKPYLGSEPSIHGVDFRKCIFLFLSNTGGKAIMEKCKSTWNSGQPRESIKLRDMQDVLMQSAYNQESGLQGSSILSRNLVDHFIPFLPLERSHVKKCIEDHILRLRSNVQVHLIEKYVIDEIMDELSWFPEKSRLYSKSGCKKIANKVALVFA